VARRGGKEPLDSLPPIEVLAFRGKDQIGSSRPEEGQPR
jgi:hypothetical protein